MSPITGLRPDIIPHQQWPLCTWFYAGPLWYYHRLGPVRLTVTDHRFYQHIDPDLRDLCRWLNSLGLHTTPSCQGHFHPPHHFQRIWDQLQREQTLIRSIGLTVRNSETHQQHLWREPAYTLPWSTFDAFFAQAARHQGTGYLGLLVPPNRPALFHALQSATHRTATAALFHDPHLTHLLGQPVFTLLVRTPTPAEQSPEWQRLTHLLQFCLSPHHATAMLQHPHPLGR